MPPAALHFAGCLPARLPGRCVACRFFIFSPQTRCEWNPHVTAHVPCELAPLLLVVFVVIAHVKYFGVHVNYLAGGGAGERALASDQPAEKAAGEPALFVAFRPRARRGLPVWSGAWPSFGHARMVIGSARCSTGERREGCPNHLIRDFTRRLEALEQLKVAPQATAAHWEASTIRP